MMPWKKKNEKMHHEGASSQEKFSAKLENTSMKIESIKNIIEIIAIICAGVWVVFNFFLKDYDNLNANIQQISKMDAEDYMSVNEKYIVNYSLSIQNIGNHIFTIDSIIISYYKFDNSSVNEGTYYDFDEAIEKNSPNGRQKIGAGSLINPYNINQSRFKQFVFAFDSVKGKSIIIYANSFGHFSNFIGKPIQFNCVSYSSMYNCWEKTYNYRNNKKIPIVYPKEDICNDSDAAHTLYKR